MRRVIWQFGFRCLVWLIAARAGFAQEEAGLVARFGPLTTDPLWPAEVHLRDRLTSSLPMIFEGGQSEGASPRLAEQQPDENRTLRAAELKSILWELAFARGVKASASPKQICGAIVEGPLDLSYLRADFPLILENCVFKGDIRLDGSRISQLRLVGSEVSGGIHASAIVVERGGMQIERCDVRTLVDLRSAKIQGDLDIIQSRFQGLGGLAILMNGSEISGSVHIMNGAAFGGEVRMIGARIGGGLRCANAVMDAGTNDALSADVASIGGDVQLRDGFRAVGTVRFQGARILGELDCSGVIIECPNSYALVAEGAELGGGMLLRGNTKFAGEVNIVGSRLSRLSLADVRFEMPRGKAFAADSIRVDGSVLTHPNVLINGQLRFVGASIQGDLTLNALSLRGGVEPELLMQRAEVGGDLMMGRGFVSAVPVNATGIKVQGSVVLDGKFRGVSGQPLFGAGIVDYALNFSGARVDGDVRFHQGTLIKGAVVFDRARIGGNLDWSGVEAKETESLNLKYATLGQFIDSGSSRPKPGCLQVDGLSYQGIERKGERYKNRDDSVADRLAWLALVDAREQMPGPYEELARYYSRIGWDDAYDEVMIRKNRVVRWPGLGLWDKLVYWSVDFGYRPFKAIKVAGVSCVLLAALNLWGMWKGFVGWTYEGGAGYALGSRWRMVVKSVLYSVDLLAPIDLGLRSSASLNGPSWFLPVQLLLRFIGWLGVTLFIVGLTGLIKV